MTKNEKKLEKLLGVSLAKNDIMVIAMAMRKRGYCFSMQMLEEGYTFIKFSCSYGPCVRHDTNTTNWHGGIGDGKTPHDAAVSAALAAIATEGKFCKAKIK